MTTTDAGFGPRDVSFEEAYAAIHQWYRESVCNPDYSARLTAQSRALIDALPEVADASELEMRAVFGEVIVGNLEWAYKKTDGRHRMAEYAHAALEGAGIDYQISNPDERERIQAGPIWPYLFCPRYWSRT